MMKGCLRWMSATLLVVLLPACSDELRRDVRACDRLEPTEETLLECDAAIALANLSEVERIHVLFNRGVIFLDLDRINDAEADFNVIAEIDPGSPYRPRGFAAIAADRQDYAAALQLYQDAIRLDPEDAILVGLRGITQYRLENNSAAIEDLSVAIDPPRDMRRSEDLGASYSAFRGAAYVEIGDYDNALPDLNEAIEQFPNYTLALLYRGLVFAARQQFDDALRDFDAGMQETDYGSWLTGKLTSIHGDIFFGPTDAGYRDGPRHALMALASFQRRFPNVSSSVMDAHRDNLFPRRLFQQPDLLLMLETGIAPLRLSGMEQDDRAAFVYYTASLVDRLNTLGDPVCAVVINDTEGMAATLSSIGNLLSGLIALTDGESGWDAIFKGIFGAIAFGQIESQAKDDSLMLAQRHGCASDTVVGILDSTTLVINWSARM